MSARRLRRRQLLVAAAALALAALAAFVVWYQGRGPGATRITAIRERQVRALWFGITETGPDSGVSTVTVRVAPPQGTDPQVGFFETEAQGTGETWRASAWMATVVASLATGVDLSRYVPSFEVDGRIDGPSAGALLAVGLMAALENRPLDPKVTITGAIGPDGTIAPVAGVAHKLEAAATSHARLLLIPQGQRQDRDWRTKQMVDVVAAGKRRGVEVREVGDIVEAYALLTHGRLPLPPSARGEPSLPEPVAADLAGRVPSWLDRCARETDTCLRVSEGLRGRTGVDAELRGARDMAARARASLARREVAAAYDQAVAATLQAAVVADVLGSTAALASSGWQAMVQRLRGDPGAGAPALDDALRAIGQVRAVDPDSALAAADAYGTVAQSLGLRKAAGAVAEELTHVTTEAGTIDLVFKAAVLRALDRHALIIAQDRLALAGAAGRRPGLGEVALAAWSSTMQRAAGANLSYFEAICLRDAARGLRVDPEALRNYMGYQDLGYLLAQVSLASLPELQKRLGESSPARVATLGASVGAYAAGSALVAKFYSLRVKMGDQGEITGVENEAALLRLLRTSGEKARAQIAAANARGLTAALPIFYYQVGRAYSAGTTPEKLEALQCFWQAGLSARLECLLAS